MNTIVVGRPPCPFEGLSRTGTGGLVMELVVKVRIEETPDPESFTE
jgi:hypothetical protein